MRKRILWLENDVFYIKPYLRGLEREGYTPIVVKTVSEAEELIKNNAFDLLILDVMIPTKSDDEEEVYPPTSTDEGHKTGLLFYRRIKQTLDTANTQVLVMTVRIDQNILDEFVDAGLPRERFATKTSLSEVPVFLEAIKSIIGTTSIG